MKLNLKQLRKAEEAISPVVATLMLILVAVGGAVGVSVFMGSFQKQSADQVGESSVQATCLTIGGSSTVFEFTKIAAPLYENTPGGCHVSNNGGGSGAGVQAVGTCAVDIGAASRDLKTSSPNEVGIYPDCDKDGVKDFGTELVVTRVAIDAVVPMVDDGIAGGSACKTAIGTITQEEIEQIWNVNGGIGAVDAGDVGRITAAEQAAGITWTEFDAACTSTNVIQPVSRTDAGGTTEVFCEKLMDKECSSPIATCTTVVFPCVLAGGLGNQGAQAIVAANADRFGYTSFGGDSNDASVQGLLTIDGVLCDGTSIRAFTCVGSRPINYVTVGEPSGAAKAYLDFVLQPKNNQDISILADFVPLYA